MLSAIPSCRTGVRAAFAAKGIAASTAAARIRSIAGPTIQRSPSAAISIHGGASAKGRRRCLSAAAYSTHKKLLAEVVRNVVERRVQLVADALHRSNGGNGDQSGDQAVLNRGRALGIFYQLQKLAHLRSPIILTPRGPA